MSVRSEITRLTSAKSQIATAISNKGVDVPSGTSISGMAALIDKIPTGGGGVPVAEELIFALKNGTRIALSSVVSINIPEGVVQSVICGDEILWRKQKYKCEVEYIEGTGTQWIDTGLRMNQDSKLEMRISHFDTDGNRRTFGSRSSATQNNFSVVSGPVGGIMSIVTDFDNYTNNRLAYVIEGNEFLEISISKEKLKINDAEKSVSTYGAFTTPSNAYLFECSGSYPAGYVSAKMRVYYCKIYDNGTPVRDFIPVLDWDDRPCMYDKVTDELFYNQGTGEFLYG